MSRVRNTNYRGGAPGTDFYLATDDSDPYSRELDVYGPALALDGHDHSAGKGLAVTRTAADSIDTAQLKAGSVTGPKIATNAVDSTHLAANSVGADEIVAGGVGSTEIADDAVLLTHLGHGTPDRIFGTSATGVPSLLQLAANMIADGSIGTLKIANLAIDNARVGNGQINGDQKLVAGTITGNSGSSAIGTAAIHGNRMMDNTIDGGKVTDATITEAKINGATSPSVDQVLGWNGSQWYWHKINYAHLDATNTPSDGQVINWNNAVGKMTWVTPSSGVLMTSVVAATISAAHIVSGWSRETALDGRMMVYDGVTFGTTWTAQNSYGASWAHTTTTSTHVHSASALGVSGTTSGPSSTNTTGSTGNTSADGGHTHTQGSLDVTGSTDGMTGGASTTDTWTIPCRAYCPIIHS